MARNPRKVSGHVAPSQIHSEPILQKIAISIRTPHERTDKALTVSIVSRRDFFGFSWESVKICLTVGNQAIVAA